jgi:hypothetical protein
MFGNFSSFEQPVRRSVCKDLNLRLLERLFRFEQNSRLKKTSLSRHPMELWILTKLVQPSRFNLSRFGMVESQVFLSKIHNPGNQYALNNCNPVQQR